MNKARILAFYLPQYHPIPENDEWYGKGFTEWDNVVRARPLFKNHYQPHIPKDLGFYDLRDADTRRKQARLAQKYGVNGFCYWTYWFGNGRKLLDMPIWEVYKDKRITFPFCLAWANHSWEKKLWDNQSENKIIVEQNYPGAEDYEAFFYEYLPLFRDERYFRVGDRLFFAVFQPLGTEDMPLFIETWQRLAEKEGIGGFYFVGHDSACRKKDEILSAGFDAVYDDNVFNIHHNLGIPKKLLLYFRRTMLKRPTVFKYKDAIRYMVTEDAKKRDVIPVMAPNWDHSPRSGSNAILLHDCEPRYFYRLCKTAMDAVKEKPEDEKIIIIKAWNEWGEGNHMEPDWKYGRGYLRALREAKDN